MSEPAKVPLLSVYVVWHSAFKDGVDHAEHLFRELCADPEFPASRGLGIPVRFRTGVDGAVPAAIDFTRATHTVAVVLVDAEMVVAPGWAAYVDDLMRSRRAGGVDLVLPVALAADAWAKMGEAVGGSQFIRLQDRKPVTVPLLLASAVMHDLCKLLPGGDVRIQVFISHAKEDGIKLARTVQRYLHETAGLADFFDATDIAHGSTFKEAIGGGLAGSAVLLAVQTDSYSSREWCRLEVLDAKRVRLPILVLAAVKVGEARSFPYIGNVPVLRWVGNSSLERLVYTLLREVLRQRWFPAHMEALCARADIALDHESFIYPPELLTGMLVRSGVEREQPIQYLYPDPPLGSEELRLLEMLDPHLHPVTPTELLA